MHSVEEMGTNVPAFLAKLWKLVEDPETSDLICWSSVCNKQTASYIAVIETCIREANIYLLFSSYRVREKL
jgi:heat shock transcription factor 1